MRLLSAADFRTVPWRNGGGVTTELWVENDTGGRDFLWRLSVARIDASGPFSEFKGYDRIIVPLRGGGITLRHDQDPPVPLKQLAPHAFAGERVTYGELTGAPAEDFNVMVRRDFGRAQVQVTRGPGDVPPMQSGARRSAVLLWTGSLTTRFGPEKLESTVTAPTLILHEPDSPPAPARLSIDAILLTVRIT